MAETDRQSEGSKRRAHLAWRSGALAVWLALTLRSWWVCDDAYISFRFARNWAEGHGPRFNLGDHTPVEGYTNFLWMALAAAAERVGARPDLVMPIVSAGCAALLLFRYHALLVQHFELRAALAGLLLLLLASFPPFAVWSTSGMETMAQCLFLFLACEGLVVRRAGGGVGAGLAALAAALVRFDGIAWGLAIAVCALLDPAARSGEGLRRVGRYLAILVAGFALYFVWRVGYYDALLPNTVVAKVGASAEVMARGGRYVASHILTFLSPFALLVALAPALRPRWRAWGLPVCVLVLAGFAYPVLTGGDFMAMGRFMMPATVFGALLLIPLHAEVAVRKPVAACLMAGVLILIAQPAAWNRALVPRPVMQSFHFRLNTPVVAQRSEAEQWRFMKRNARLWAERGRVMAAVAEPGESWVVGPLGATGYFSRLTTYDQVGLVVPDLARRHYGVALASPGHDTFVERSELLFLEPDYLGAWLLAGECMLDSIEAELPVGRGRRLRIPPVTSRYAPARLAVSSPELFATGVLVLKRVESGRVREEMWKSFDAARPTPCPPATGRAGGRS